jgi:hypothetical protein
LGFTFGDFHRKSTGRMAESASWVSAMSLAGNDLKSPEITHCKPSLLTGVAHRKSHLHSAENRLCLANPAHPPEVALQAVRIASSGDPWSTGLPWFSLLRFGLGPPRSALSLSLDHVLSLSLSLSLSLLISLLISLNLSILSSLTLSLSAL